jgi:hypothetical protein
VTWVVDHANPASTSSGSAAHDTFNLRIARFLGGGWLACTTAIAQIPRDYDPFIPKNVIWARLHPKD